MVVGSAIFIVVSADVIEVGIYIKVDGGGTDDQVVIGSDMAHYRRVLKEEHPSRLDSQGIGHEECSLFVSISTVPYFVLALQHIW